MSALPPKAGVRYRLADAAPCSYLLGSMRASMYSFEKTGALRWSYAFLVTILLLSCGRPDTPWARSGGGGLAPPLQQISYALQLCCGVGSR